MTINIMCFGDSLTHGWIPVPEGAPTSRYAPEVRWTGVMAAELGEGYHIIEEGLSGRTTAADDPTDPRLNGSAYLPAALASHLPLDLVTIMLGTNDTKSHLHRTVSDIANGMSILLGQVLSSAGGVGTTYPAPKVLLIAPPPLAAERPHPWFSMLFDESSVAKSAQLTQAYADLADFMKIDFLAAGEVISSDGSDGIHWTEQANQDFGLAVAAKVRDILG